MIERSSSSPPIKKPIRSVRKIGWKDTLTYEIMIAPSLILFLLFTIYPFLTTIYYSFTNYSNNHLFDYKFIGLENYVKLFTEGVPFEVIGRSFKYAFLMTGFQVLFSVPLAVVLSNRKVKGKGALRTIFYFPAVISSLIIGYIFSFLFSTSFYGPINNFLQSIGLEKINFFGDPDIALYSVVFTQVWQWTGWAAVIIIANITSIPQTYYEAATIDGASSLQQFWSITVPQLYPSISFIVLGSLTGGLKVYDIIVSTTGGGPGEATLTEMEYSLTYTYGPSEVTVTVQSKPLATAKEIAAPENTEKYVAISNIGAVRLTVSSMSGLIQADSIASSHTESMVIEAAGVVSTQSTQLNVHGRKEDTKLKQETTSYFSSQSPREESTYEVEEIYQDGKLTTTANKGLPSTSTIDWEDIRDHIGEELILSILSPEYWQDATITDLGSVYYTEFVLNDNFGNTMQNSICSTFWQDPAYLYNLADEYKNVTLTGYLSVDKYTGIMVAAGYCFEGVHTIKGREYKMSVQYDQSYEAPAKGAYLEITGERLPDEEPENKPTPLFYHVTGPDGQEMWLFGTIHVGDERTAYLPEEIYDAFTASDALALECNTKLFEQQVEEDAKLAEKVSNLYYFKNGKTLDSLMEEEDYQRAYTLLKAVGGNSMNMPYAKPCLWSDLIEAFYLRQCYLLHGDQGVEERLMLWAEDQEKEILEIESSMAQLQMFTGFSTDLQLWMLLDAVEGDPHEYWTSVAELYELWCAGDEAALRQEISNQWDTSEMTEEELAKYTPLMEEYNKAMDFDRNEGMLDVAIEYLESGKVIFYAVGLAHLLDDTNGLVNALQEAGYTVELVVFN